MFSFVSLYPYSIIALFVGKENANLGEKLKPGRDDQVGWIGYLNEQGLYLPSTQFVNLLENFEKEFDILHGDILTTVHDPIAKLIEILKVVKYQVSYFQDRVSKVTLLSIGKNV